MHVEIRYCERCGGLGMAVEVRDRIREACGEAFSDIEMTPVDDGSFSVHTGGEEVFTTDRAEYEPERVTRAVCDAAD
jgi:predicted Rdx family selenoprotein